MLIEQTAEWSINGARELRYHTSCQLGNLTQMGFVTQLLNLQQKLPALS
jgi:hypothetical protein